MFLHKYQVIRSVYYAQRWRLKRALGIKDRPRNPVVDGDLDWAFERHLRLCRLLNQEIAALRSESRKVACEIGCGDCLSSSDLLLGLGFEKIYLVEHQPIVIDERQRQLLARLATQTDLPNALDSIEKDNPDRLNPRIEHIPSFFEDSNVPEQVDLIFSNDVLEHVEDLETFFVRCKQMLKPHGVMVHKFDLSGHEFFEDPIPPLDFQTYPDWLYQLMFPKFRRSCRWLLDEIVAHARFAGFQTFQTRIIRAADIGYTRSIHPQLRSKARARTVDQLLPLDVVITFSCG